jgi:hypothetical protein
MTVRGKRRGTDLSFILCVYHIPDLIGNTF